MPPARSHPQSFPSDAVGRTCRVALPNAKCHIPCETIPPALPTTIDSRQLAASIRLASVQPSPPTRLFPSSIYLRRILLYCAAPPSFAAPTAAASRAVPHGAREKRNAFCTCNLDDCTVVPYCTIWKRREEGSSPSPPPPPSKRLFKR